MARDEPGYQEHRVGAAGDDLGQERDRRFASKRGEDADLVYQAQCGRL